ncbi:MAG: 23S rRNA (guanosine(2251)-2'-O)-methyltransferase RlmB [Candidatus Pacebacteria bacterium]|nr:23S rRNA (guanosine(2251)-2'-O)-methyltransferase RlmB [Candidatus Paceibacterota bacterium]
MANQEKIYIYGKKVLLEALSYAPKSIKKVFIEKEVNDDSLRDMLQAKGIPTFTLGMNEVLPGMDKLAVHQGVIGQMSVENLVIPYRDFIETLNVNGDTVLVILGELQDPQNVGAIIRSSAAFGVAGVLVPEHNQAPVTGAVIKASAGMAFRVPLVSIGNVNTTARDLKELGFWIYGLAGEAKETVTEQKFDTPTAFILGNEEKGLREKTRAVCDILVSIPINPQCESLNVAASSAVALYAWSTKHEGALKKNEDRTRGK